MCLLVPGNFMLELGVRPLEFGGAEPHDVHQSAPDTAVQPAHHAHEHAHGRKEGHSHAVVGMFVDKQRPASIVVATVSPITADISRKIIGIVEDTAANALCPNNFPIHIASMIS